jgi:hypothetical protein
MDMQDCPCLLTPACVHEVALGWTSLTRLLTDYTLRQSLAENALRDISRFTWSAAVDKFEATLSAPT